MAKKEPYPGPAEALALYEELVAAHPDVARKGAKNPYTARNGHMFSFLDATGLCAIRLSADDQQAFLARYDSGPVEQYGRTMRDYVAVPRALLEDTVALLPWFDQSHEYIGTLKAKPTKKPKA